jgi:hypothetical protein
MAVAGLVVVGLSAMMGVYVITAFGGLAMLLGATGYVGLSRYRERFEQFQYSIVDFTTTPTFVYSLIHVLALTLLFAVLLFLAVTTEFVPSSTVDVDTANTTLVFFSGVIPGVVLGAGYPAVIQRRADDSLLSVARIAVGVENVLTIGAYCLLLVFYEPVSAAFYAIAYVVSRLTILAAFYGGSRLRATIGTP